MTADKTYPFIGLLLLGVLGLSACGGSNDAKPPATVTPPVTPPSVTPVSGLDSRPANPDCVAPDVMAAVGTSITLERYFPNLTFNRPLVFIQAPGNTSRWYVVEQAGVVKVFANDQATGTATDFIDIRSWVNSGGEKGLLGMAFHPDFQNNGYVYLSYTAGNLESRISRFTSPDGGQSLDPASEVIILSVTQPYGNHNGGHIAFGPDGYLYIGLGDGGSGGDPAGNGQNTKTLLGAMLRIDVNVSATDWSAGIRYSIPSSNPFASSASCAAEGCPEIYAWGLRNPWRWSFDSGTGDLWLADVGQNQWEEVDLIELGGNYGWNIREGAHCYGGGACITIALNEPVAEYDHSNGDFSITGGYVYRGSASPGLLGKYLFGDFGSGRIWSLDYYNDPAAAAVELIDTTYNISSFAQGHDGELYVLSYYSGEIFHIVESSTSGGSTMPSSIKDTGCVDKADPKKPAAGLVPYDINAPFWTDGATKARYLALPDNTTISIDANGDWEFPAGTVLMKNFRLAGKLIETRFLMRHPDGSWNGYSYEWNDAQTDASLVTAGKSKDIAGQSWLYPGSTQCMRCHTAVAKFAVGPETAQLNRDFLYPSTGRTANQLYTFEQIGLFSAGLSGAPDSLPALANPYDSTADLDDRARSWLHSNCAYCHVSGGPTPAAMDLHYATPMSGMNICNTSPLHGGLGLTDPRLLAPAEPARSVISARIRLRDVNGMPPLGSSLIDSSGTAMVDSWINGLDGSCL